MAAVSYAELKAKLEDLRSSYEEKFAKLKKHEAELEAAKREASKLRHFLHESGCSNTSVVPSEMRAGPGRSSNSETELQRVLKWLSEQVTLADPTVFNAATDIVVGDQLFQIRNVVQWRLVDDLKLSVPEGLAPEISNLLSAIKMKGVAVALAKAKALLDSWTLQQMEDNTGVMTLLIHKESNSACIVADFPDPPLPSARRHLQRWAGVSVGDHVEVNFHGQWFTGTVCFIQEDGIIDVHCDVDPPDVMTTTPIHMLRRLSGASSGPGDSRKQDACGKSSSNARQAST